MDIRSRLFSLRGLLARPLILAYLIAGFFIGPFGMGWVKSKELIGIISELGLIFMLFMVGSERREVLP